MPSRGWRLIRFDMRLSVICLWPGLLSKLAGIIKREEVIFKEGGETSEQMKTEVGGQREERKIEAYIPCRVSCGALCRTQTINLQTTTARQPFCLQSSKAITTLKNTAPLIVGIIVYSVQSVSCASASPCLFLSGGPTRSSVVSFSRTKVCLQLILQCKHGRT